MGSTVHHYLCLFKQFNYLSAKVVSLCLELIWIVGLFIIYSNTFYRTAFSTEPRISVFDHKSKRSMYRTHFYKLNVLQLAAQQGIIGSGF